MSNNDLPTTHPLHVYNEYLYLVSTTNNKYTTYLYKFENGYGALVAYNFNTNTGTVSPVKFDDEYNFSNIKIKVYQEKFDNFNETIKFIEFIRRYADGNKRQNS